MIYNVFILFMYFIQNKWITINVWPSLTPLAYLHLTFGQNWPRNFRGDIKNTYILFYNTIYDNVYFDPKTLIYF